MTTRALTATPVAMTAGPAWTTLRLHDPHCGPQMGNVVVQCPTCRGWDVNKKWNFTNPYYQCASCGFLWS